MTAASRDGLLLLAKPSGPTSHDVVNRVRRWTGQRRVGHAGTLDPLASGLLPVVLGRATRLVRFLPRSPKVYTGTIRLGIVTDSDDVSGAPLRRHVGPLPDREAVSQHAGRLRGRLLQVPPAVSARKVDGTRAYRLAREGRPVLAAPSEVEVSGFDLTPTGEADLYAFVAEVTGGTYIRSLARDLGEYLGCGAALASLSRTRIGPMRLEDAIELPADPTSGPEIDAALIPLERMPLSAVACRLEGTDAARSFVAGGPVPAGSEPLEEGFCSVFDSSGMLLGMAEYKAGRLHPRVVLPRTP